jgi:hypothetical protein
MIALQNCLAFGDFPECGQGGRCVLDGLFFGDYSFTIENRSVPLLRSGVGRRSNPPHRSEVFSLQLLTVQLVSFEIVIRPEEDDFVLSSFSAPTKPSIYPFPWSRGYRAKCVIEWNFASRIGHRLKTTNLYLPIWLFSGEAFVSRQRC